MTMTMHDFTDCAAEGRSRSDADANASTTNRRRSWWQRFFRALVEFFAPRFSHQLPPPPTGRPANGTRILAAATAEHGEFLLFSILRASEEYQSAAIVVAREAISARGGGEAVYADFSIRFALSRLPADKEGRIPIERLRDVLPHMPYKGAIVPALLRLEEEGVVFLVLKTSDDPMAQLLRSHITHIEIRRPL